VPGSLKVHPVLTTTYAVASKDVKLTITFGNKQMGASIATIGSRELAIGAIKQLKVGKATALKGKTLHLKSIVSDINDKTNWTNVRLVLEGGKANAQHDLALEVDEHGQSVEYRVEVKFT